MNQNPKHPTPASPRPPVACLGTRSRSRSSGWPCSYSCSRPAPASCATSTTWGPVVAGQGTNNAQWMVQRGTRQVGGWYSGGHAQQGGEASSCTVSNSRATILWPADSPTHGRPHTRSCNKPHTHPTAISSTAQPPPHTHTTANPAHPTYPRARVVDAARGVGVLVAVIPAAGGGGVNDAWIVAGPDAGGELLTHVAAAAAVGVAAGAVLVLACAAAAQGR